MTHTVTLVAILFVFVMWKALGAEKKNKPITPPCDFSRPPKITIRSGTDYDTGYTTISVEYPDKKPERKGKDDDN